MGCGSELSDAAAKHASGSRSTAGDAYQEAEYKVDKDCKARLAAPTIRERAKFWEIWHRASRRVVLGLRGSIDEILDEAEPHLELAEFLPCPKPAYGSVQRGSLVPGAGCDAVSRTRLTRVNIADGRAFTR